MCPLIKIKNERRKIHAEYIALFHYRCFAKYIHMYVHYVCVILVHKTEVCTPYAYSYLHTAEIHMYTYMPYYTHPAYTCTLHLSCPIIPLHTPRPDCYCYYSCYYCPPLQQARGREGNRLSRLHRRQ